MAAPDYYRKQIELLLEWAASVTDLDLRMKLIERALDFFKLANCTDDQALRLVQEALETTRRSNTRNA